MSQSHRTILIALILCFTAIPACLAQSSILICNASSSPPIVRAEGITERIGDIVLNCSGGTSGETITGNFSVFLNVNITNVVAGNMVSGVLFTIDNGSGPQAVSQLGALTSSGGLTYNGLSFKLSPQGTAVLRIADIRAAAIQLMLAQGAPIVADLSFNENNLVSLTNSMLTVGTVERSLYSSQSVTLICTQRGSPLPSNPTFSSLLAAGAAFASTRLTEGFGDAFQPLSGWANLNAQTGDRVIVNYSGFPQGAQLYVPDEVAGSNALQPTGGGDFGVPASGGQYAPGANSSLLLSRVLNANANGAGGTPVYTPGTPGSGAVTFDKVNPVLLSNGSGYVVYEVVDANNNVLETAQFPTFLGLAPNVVSSSVNTTEAVTLAPVSGIETASATEPIPRFAAVAPLPDCSIVGDCGANYFPRISVDTTALTFTAQQGSSYQVAYFHISNLGGGVLEWTLSIAYQSGAGWLRPEVTSGTGKAEVRVDAVPGSLTPGVYQASITLNGGPIGGSASIPVTLTITAAPPPPIPVPTITGVVNAASFAAGPVTPGSLATIQGTNFAGSNVSVTFNGFAAQVLFSNSTQINVLVPASLGSAASAQVVVSVDGNQSTAQTVSLASMAPAVFPNAVLNQDYSVNSAGNPAAVGSVIQIFATGLSGSGAITATIQGETVATPYYAGPAPGLTGVQQVDLILPTNLTGSSVPVTLCGAVAGQPVCSAAVPVAISQ